jgi:hypothetical protein
MTQVQSPNVSGGDAEKVPHPVGLAERSAGVPSKTTWPQVSSSGRKLLDGLRRPIRRLHNVSPEIVTQPLAASGDMRTSFTRIFVARG